ncbi:MAG: PAS domain-containing sensor histidine kinase [Rhodospirillaceae bacterium]|jgi:PAS domain S-box-containing protein|nr:PAS domain-containing sensor histidine kinase [Rhodospirillaceae bacterium]MBT5455563.1 PAS domain-containing sensor histidine kinase [Rhodospirillaceae bacterium]
MILAALPWSLGGGLVPVCENGAMLASMIKSSLQCRLCNRIGLVVLLCIVVTEAAILIPSYLSYERDLLLRLERVSRAAVASNYSTRPNATPQEILILSRTLERKGVIAGGVLFDANARKVGSFGDQPAIATEALLADKFITQRSADGRWYDVIWTTDTLKGRYSLIARLDAADVASELESFVWRIIGLVLLISFVVCAATMVIVARKVLLPLLKLRDNLTAASRDPTNIDKYRMPNNQTDELGQVVLAANRLLEQVSVAHRDSLYAMTAMADRSADAILAYDRYGDILYANLACVRMCGFDRVQELVSERLPSFDFELGGDPLSLPRSLGKGAYSREAFLIGRDGARTPVMINAARVPSDSRSPIRFYASITDISALRLAQDKLEQQNLELKGASRAKSEFLANMSHELRTPLNAIIGFSDIFLHGLFGPLGDRRYQEYAKDINDSGTHLLNIINDILDLSKVEAGKLELHEEALNLAELVRATLRLLGERAINHGVRMTEDLPDHFPHLHGDDRAVKQMLINLLSNAVKFTEEGGSVTVSARQDSGAITLTVADTGIGIHEDDIPTALEPFRQIDGSLSRQSSGTGLGLPLVKSLIELHGGTLTLVSKQGVGTTVILSFPPERTVNATAGTDTRSVA